MERRRIDRCNSEHFYVSLSMRVGVGTMEEVFDIFNDLTFEFAMQTGRASTFELRDEKDNVIAKGQRQ